ncbi:hypothetical protein ABID21_001514 [Pseudorhizobium tarimense]|uniref:Uncharacterized protein n=1 Tax=Pseudorhizobium tarimense TaxID=1079109 RepID=A0ABV2H4C4_9HYPH|nr:hypothetical protein [Pseudorhizobium tarimense]MCJ8518634.1 hypothetical protein [Pseudorhizobium tarimense]
MASTASRLYLNEDAGLSHHEQNGGESSGSRHARPVDWHLIARDEADAFRSALSAFATRVRTLSAISGVQLLKP